MTLTAGKRHRNTGLVRKEGLEPSRREALEPKSSASTSSATFALPAPDCCGSLCRDALRIYLPVCFISFHCIRIAWQDAENLLRDTLQCAAILLEMRAVKRPMRCLFRSPP